MSYKEALANFKKKLHGPTVKFLVLPHKNPDGDAMGSCLGLALYLRKFGHEVNIIAPTDFPYFLRWLPNVDQVLVFSEKQNSRVKKKIHEANVLFFVDFNTLSRVEPLDVFLKSSPAFKILIDHHLAPETFDLMFCDPLAPATAVLVFRLIEQMGHLDCIDRDLAMCLYTALVSDTGSFRFSSVTSETHIIAAHLMDKGINAGEVQDRLYAIYTQGRMRLLTKTLQGMKILAEYRTAYMYVTSQDMEDCHYQKGDTEGFVNYGLSLKNVLLAALFIEDCTKGIIKISFRSKTNFDVNTFAREHFQGGGHKNAAGGVSREDLKATLEHFLGFLPLYKDQLS
ncbi:DHH family phosphoesterase [Bacteroidetes bacterium endosymbiont of Geopemphigus sp.]|uniref:DHH family phosphoesterase n=1 Tax=Bacteroidetes bacterium endosymbiont of Geopemphigus sp. TaxID=2047937 RepID=UPI000CD03B92|nr:bifunctional oligoribonuclease/PAP phosphatase NrnA [Bacteroidetes bacterium endosymbiont of Geopemphigus sp.]